MPGQERQQGPACPALPAHHDAEHRGLEQDHQEDSTEAAPEDDARGNSDRFGVAVRGHLGHHRAQPLKMRIPGEEGSHQDGGTGHKAQEPKGPRIPDAAGSCRNDGDGRRRGIGQPWPWRRRWRA
jgi:hypothetical protein